MVLSTLRATQAAYDNYVSVITTTGVYGFQWKPTVAANDEIYYEVTSTVDGGMNFKEDGTPASSMPVINIDDGEGATMEYVASAQAGHAHTFSRTGGPNTVKLIVKSVTASNGVTLTDVEIAAITVPANSNG